MSENNQFKVAFTGHRHLKYVDVESSLIKLHSDFPGAIWITGGAYGIDSHAARFALDHSIPLWLVLPFPAKILCARWPSGGFTGFAVPVSQGVHKVGGGITCILNGIVSAPK